MPNVEESAFRALFSGSRRSRMKARLSLPRDCRQTPRGSRSARTSLSRATLSLSSSLSRSSGSLPARTNEGAQQGVPQWLRPREHVEGGAAHRDLVRPDSNSDRRPRRSGRPSEHHKDPFLRVGIHHLLRAEGRRVHPGAQANAQSGDGSARPPNVDVKRSVSLSPVRMRRPLWWTMMPSPGTVSRHTTPDVVSRTTWLPLGP
jgi:hypothetical protein